jgi:1-acylglycerone phosphate reductase
MQPFGVTVIDLKTAAVQSNFFENYRKQIGSSLLEDLIYAPAKAAAEKVMSGDTISSTGMLSSLWADQVVKDLLKKKPSPKI